MCGPDWVRMRAVCGPHAARCPSLIYSKSFVFPLPQIHQGHFGFTLTCCWDKSRLVDLLFKECLIICAFIFCLSEHHLMSEQGKNGLYPAPSSTFVFNQHASFIKFEFIWTAMNNDMLKPKGVIESIFLIWSDAQVSQIFCLTSRPATYRKCIFFFNIILHRYSHAPVLPAF